MQWGLSMDLSWDGLQEGIGKGIWQEVNNIEEKVLTPLI